MGPIAAYASNVYAPVEAIAPATRRTGDEAGSQSGGSRFQASEGHSHAELSSTCPTCGHKLNLSV
ncbi:MAG: hypothetical protein FJX54_18685 [Alphaproteobacteria bacterium]|nr:hypothetical protein [Alphaproteobacteria bacterium]